MTTSTRSGSLTRPATYVNTEGRVQQARRAVTPPGLAREDWRIVRALSEIAGTKLPYDSLPELRQRLGYVAPHLVKYDTTQSPVFTDVAGKLNSEAAQSASASGKITVPINELKDFYMTDVISKSSQIMAKCKQAVQEMR
eukprot:Colp12_sorted_trinity150504_noHs@28337